MLFGSFTTTYSLKVNTILVLWTGTLTEPGSGEIFFMTGGIVSFGPPVGGVVVLAQECENITEPSTSRIGIAGSRFVSFLFIRVRC